MADLEQELRTLGTQIDVPTGPDVRMEVRRRVAEPPARSQVWHAARRPGLGAVGTVAALMVLLALALTLSSQVRATAGDLFRFAGIEVSWGEPSPSGASRRPVEPLPSQASVDKVAAAQREVDFPVGVPSRLGTPDRVLVADRGRVVSLIYTRSGEPIRLDEFDGTLDPVFAKVVGTEAVHVDVSGADALWLREPHSVTYIGRDGTPFEASARISGATLIWQSGQVAYRLEGELNLAEAAAIAASLS